MEQSSSTAHNMLIEEVKVRGEFRSDALESGNKGVQAFCSSDTPVCPGAVFPQWCMLYVQVLFCGFWMFPEAPSCLCRLEFLHAVCIQPWCMLSWKVTMDVSGE